MCAKPGCEADRAALLSSPPGCRPPPPPLALDPHPQIHAAPCSPSPLFAAELNRSSPSLLAVAHMGCHRFASRTPLQHYRAAPLCHATAPMHRWLTPHVPQSHAELAIPKPPIAKLHPSAGTIRLSWGKHLTIEPCLQPFPAPMRTSPSYEAALHSSPTQAPGASTFGPSYCHRCPSSSHHHHGEHHPVSLFPLLTPNPSYRAALFPWSPPHLTSPSACQKWLGATDGRREHAREGDFPLPQLGSNPVGRPIGLGQNRGKADPSAPEPAS
jgi:hypothetical protein